MTWAQILVLSFLSLQPRPTCTWMLPRGADLREACRVGGYGPHAEHVWFGNCVRRIEL